MTQTHHIPKEFSTQTAALGTEIQVAQKELTSTSVCPSCSATMRIMSVNGHNASCCIPCRIVLPIV